MYGIVICKSFYFTKSLLINDIFLRYKCPVKSFAFFLLAFINFWVWVFVYTLRKRYRPCCFTVIFTLLGCYLVRFQAIKTLFLIQVLGIAGPLVFGFKPLQVSQAAQAGSRVACLDRASIIFDVNFLNVPYFFPGWLCHISPICLQTAHCPCGSRSNF